jgi:deoxyribodipyrimidine photo-lyase
MSAPITIFWFRRDLRLVDNRGLFKALKSSDHVLPLFVFDTDILSTLPKNDHRITFIYDSLQAMHLKLQQKGRGILVKHGRPVDIFKELINQYDIKAVYCNADHEPYGQERDEAIKRFLTSHSISFCSFLDHLIFGKSDILKSDGSPYKVFTPYSQKWRLELNSDHLKHYPSEHKLDKLYPISLIFNKVLYEGNDFTNDSSTSNGAWKDNINTATFPELKAIGFERSDMSVPGLMIDEDLIRRYDQTRDYPAQEGTSRLGVHLRFGTAGIRDLVVKAAKWNDVFLNELIWREFYAMILWHYPDVVNNSFKVEYDRILWINNEFEFERWKMGRTGYPMVDAGMRQLDATGYMHNRLRMITASFLTKHLLIDWRLGEAYFAQQLFDYELSSNNGGWQWAAGTGCDAAPYFRIFNPIEQQKKFDPKGEFIQRWIPELHTRDYPEPVVDHKKARERCLSTYKNASKS